MPTMGKGYGDDMMSEANESTNILDKKGCCNVNKCAIF